MVAFTLSPSTIVERYEEKTPSLEKRLHAIESLQQQGWRIGLRFDPLILCQDYRHQYDAFLQQVFSRVDASQLHSVSLGSLRLPNAFFKRVSSMYPDSDLFAAPFVNDDNGMMAYQAALADKLHRHCEARLLEYIAAKIYFPCW